MKPYILEITTFKYKASIDAEKFWARDTGIEADYTSKQPGFISRESGFSAQDNEVVVAVKWRSDEDAIASMNKFMGDDSVSDYAAMIDGPTMQMKRYMIK